MAWETETSSFGPEECEGVVKDAKFIEDSSYQEGVVLMSWNLETDDPEFDEFEVRYSIGRDWETDDGKTVEHVRGKTKFHEQSLYGRIINRVIGKGNGADYADSFKGALDELSKRGDPTDASIWEGMKFRFEQEEINFGRGINAVTRLMPVEYLGTEDGGGKKKAAAKKGGKKTKADPREQIIELAKKHDDHESFMEEALKVDGVTDDDDLFAEVTDEEEGIFAEVNG